MNHVCQSAIDIITPDIGDAMLSTRRTIAQQKTPNEVADWPFCEALITSVIFELPDANIKQLVDLEEVCFIHRIVPYRDEIEIYGDPV
ncbi:MAG: hypothetical protein B7Z75_09425 [Acidocella sp. 20-57-95]|nr:MAG: hypothetical protein B7Z75_09425 [Acidocella sp. 20-57-95]OYV58874.1 MAG: hypothetical protein B7Z71_09225 [Acidocella sp. 21-58-7]HQT65136.1 hypothetical protein [Acidocella sp.]HQU05064.1 hypothetical protein [Acidocella sp.]